MIVHMLKTCDTCRKSVKALQAAGLEPKLVEIRDDGITQGDLARFHAEFGEALVNRRSTTWRNLSEDERARDPLELVADHPTLMKRPVIETDDGRLFLGWDKTVQAAVLPQA